MDTLKNRDLLKKSYFLRLVYIAFSCTVHITSFLQFLARIETFKDIPGFNQQFILLLLVSAGLSIFFLYAKQIKYVLILILLHVLVFILIIYPLSQHISILFTLVTLIIVEAMFFLPSVYNYIGSLGITGLTLLLQRPVIAWGRTIPPPPMDETILLAFFLVLLLIFTGIINELFKAVQSHAQQIQRMDTAIKQLMNANVGFQQYARQKEVLSRMNERKRITSEIHDTIGYTLTNIIMMMEAVISNLRKSPPQLEVVENLVQSVKSQAKEGLNEVRKSLHILREEKEEQARGLKAISKIAKTFQESTQVEVHLDFGNLPLDLDDEYSTILYRLIQEGMTNAFRHGKTKVLWINLRQDESGIFLRIRDKGIGSSKPEQGIGLSGMWERVAAIGGRISAHNVADGFELSAWIPRKKE